MDSVKGGALALKNVLLAKCTLLVSAGSSITTFAIAASSLRMRFLERISPPVTGTRMRINFTIGSRVYRCLWGLGNFYSPAAVTYRFYFLGTEHLRLVFRWRGKQEKWVRAPFLKLLQVVLGSDGDFSYKWHSSLFNKISSYNRSHILCN